MLSVCDPSHSSSLDHLKLMFLFGDVRVPDCRSILYVWPHKCVIQFLSR